MLHERPVEPDGWTDKLDRLDNLPGEPWTDKNAAWDKLYARLHEKPARKASPWWLAAAVFLLLVVSASLFITHNHKEAPPSVKINPSPAHTGSPAPAPRLPEKIVPATAGTMAGGRRPRPVAAMNKMVPIACKPAEPLNAGQVSVTAPVIKPDTPLLAVTTVPASPKKLRVVHINELESPAANDLQLARQPGNRSFRFLLNHTDDAGTVSYETSSAGYTPLKIKIRTQN